MSWEWGKGVYSIHTHTRKSALITHCVQLILLTVFSRSCHTHNMNDGGRFTRDSQASQFSGHLIWFLCKQ